MGGGETSNAQILPSHTLNHVTPTPQASAVRHLGYWHHYSIPVGSSYIISLIVVYIIDYQLLSILVDNLKHV